MFIFSQLVSENRNQQEGTAELIFRVINPFSQLIRYDVVRNVQSNFRYVGASKEENGVTRRDESPIGAPIVRDNSR